MGKQKEKKGVKAERAPMGQTIADGRFAAAQYDPRFQRFPKAKAKVEIDDRFTGMFENVAFQSRVAVDKRGRKLGKYKHKEDMRKYYRLQNEEEDWGREIRPEGNEENEDGTKEGMKGLDEGAKQGQSKVKLQHTTAEKGAKIREAPTKRTTRKSEKKRAAKLEPSRSALIDEAARNKIDASRKFSTLNVASSTDQTDDRDPDPQAGNGLEADKHSSGSDTGADSDSTDDSDSLDEKDQKAAERWARVRGLAGTDTSSSDDSSSSGDFSDDDKASEQDVDLSEWGVGAMAANPDEKVPEAEEETARLAILDLDWSKVEAVDIFAMLRSFLSKRQSITRVTVYPSDYGLQKMAEEEKLGPVGLFGQSRIVAAEAAEKPTKDAPQKGGKFEMSAAEQAAILETLNEQDSGEEDEGDYSEVDEEFPNKDDASSEDGDDTNDRDSARQAPVREAEASGSEDDEVSRRRLQLYESSRLRYYYAIVECSDVATAAHLYKECDGMEFEHSASTFDLRFVPDSEDFSTRKVRDEAADVPAGYKPPDVKIAAMLHTKPRLTWDADDDDRKRTLSRRLTKEQLRDDDFKAYLGSESDEESGPDETAGERYKQLLNGSARDVRKGGTKDWGVAERASDEEAAGGTGRPGKADRSMELEVTFGGGLDELSQRLKAKREEAASSRNDTVWEAYLRRKREKKLQAKRIGKKVESEVDDSDGDYEHDDPYFKHDDNVFDDPFFKDSEDAVEEGNPPQSDTDAAAKKQSSAAARKAKWREQRAAEEAERRREAELELLLMDDTALQDAAKLGGPLQSEPEAVAKSKGKLSRKARLAAKKAERLARKAGNDDEEGDGPGQTGAGFKVDVGDSRFEALFTSSDFALDPTDPRFLAGTAASTIMAEAAKRRKGAKHSSKTTVDAATEPSGSSENIEALVVSLKRKGQRQDKLKGEKAKLQKSA